MAKALVAAPSAPSLRAACFLLESLGFEVAALHSADEALAQAGGADLILLDARLGEGSDMSLLERLRAANRQACLFFVTENGNRATIREALEAGADDYLVKPFDRDLLAFKLAQAGARGRLAVRMPLKKPVQDNGATISRRYGA